MKYMMNTKELARLAVIKSALDWDYTAKQARLVAARKLGISVQWVKHLKQAVREQGDVAVIHGNAGRHPANATDEGIWNRIIALKKSELYRDANFTHFRELLAEREHIQVSYATLSLMLKGAGITSPKTRRSAGDGGRCGSAGRKLANRCKPTPRPLTGWDGAFHMPCTGFRMMRPSRGQSHLPDAGE
jgi:transposase